jgi:hypothetical protein
MSKRTEDADFEILPRLEQCLPGHTPEQIEELDESLRAHGMLQGIILCKIRDLPGRYILDGHTRYRRSLELDVACWVNTDDTLHFASVEEAVVWICKNQLARRNLTVEQQEGLIGHLYNAEKKALGANQHVTGWLGQNEPPSPTAEKIAKDIGVSASKVKRAGAKVEKIDELGLTAAVNSGKIKKISKAAVDEIAASVEAEPERRSEIVDEVIERAVSRNGTVKTAKRTTSGEPAEVSLDPNRAHALEHWSESIKTVILALRKTYDADFVVHLKRNVLEAFRMPIPENLPLPKVAKASSPAPAPVMPLAANGG